jgi:hypothetical protein
MTGTSKEAHAHRMVTYKSVRIGDFRKRYRRCENGKCEHRDTVLIPIEFCFQKSCQQNTNLGIESVDSVAKSPTLE